MRAQGLRRVLTTAAVVLGAPLAVTALAVAQVSLHEAFQAPFKAIGLVEGDSDGGERRGSGDPVPRDTEPTEGDEDEAPASAGRARPGGGAGGTSPAGGSPTKPEPPQVAGAPADSQVPAATPPSEDESDPPPTSPPAGPAPAPEQQDGPVDAVQDTAGAVNDKVQGVLDEVGELVPPLER